jgi:signal transduction histidine kinase/response regulator of citrate/malate metabolism/HPt (histidine-containing phosphotransfer) domain-containing protein
MTFRRILIIDDNHDIHADFRKVFDGARAQISDMDRLDAELFGGERRSCGNEVLSQVVIESAFQGLDGIRMAVEAFHRGEPYYMAFVDVRMPPGIDGVQTIKALWKEVPGLQCVICTAYSDYDWADIARELGKSGNLLILKKPFDAVEVLQLAQSMAEKADLAASATSYLRTLEQQVDELKRKEMQLEVARAAAEAASLAKSEFLANMSHELRTPLNGVIGMGQLLLGTLLDSQQRRYVETAKLSAKVLLQLINDVLDFSKIEAGRMELETIDFEVHSVIDSAMTLVVDQARDKEIEFVSVVERSVPSQLRGDPGRLQQILTNLLTNAVKFTSAGHVGLQVSLVSQNDEHVVVRCAVTDTGIGIPAERLSLLFQSFTQVDSSTTRKYGGTGLGLSISKRLAELMGGQIGVESEPGQGSTFWFTAQLGRSAGAAPRAGAASSRLRGLKALVVDDHPLALKSLAAQLEAWGFACETAVDGAAALDVLRAAAAKGRPFDVALVDLGMPGLRGDELADAIRANPALREMAVILMTASSDDRHEHDLDDDGLTGRLSKPVTASRLMDAIMASFNDDRFAIRPAAALADGIAAAQGAGRASEPRNAHILLVEDNDVNQFVAVEMLKAAGYRCDYCANGKQAIQAVAATVTPYDLVLMDCQMPEMDGYEATRAIRQWERQRGTAPELPIVALTANVLAGDRQRCLDAGMDDYLKKPLDRDELLSAVERHLTRDGRPARTGTLSAGSKADDLRLAGNDTMADGPRGEMLGDGDECNPPLMWDSLVQRCTGDLEFLRELLEMFDRQADVDLDQIERSVVERDAERTVQLAHRLKGAAANLSAESLRRAAARLEDLGRRNAMDEAQRGFADLRDEREQLRRYLHEFVPLRSGALADGVGD